MLPSEHFCSSSSGPEQLIFSLFTMPRQYPAKTRAFVVTQWNLDCNYEEVMAKYAIRFIAYGLETCPTTTTQHHQLFMYFKGAVSTKPANLNKIGNYFGPKHCRVMPMMGSFQDNEIYCSKESTLTKLGQEPKQGARGDIEETRDAILAGELTADDLAVENPEFYHQYGRTMRDLETIHLRKKWRTWKTIGIWYTGPSGSGKSHMAYSDYHPDTHYEKTLEDEWWDGYKGQPIVILNEFRGQVKYHELLSLVDKWPKKVKQRNREPVPFLAREVRITSIMAPKDAYKNVLSEEEPFRQFRRRFKTCYMENREIVRVEEMEGDEEQPPPQRPRVEDEIIDLTQSPPQPVVHRGRTTNPLAFRFI